MKVRGAVLRAMGLPAPYAQSQPLALEDLELDAPGPGELLVRTLAAGQGSASSPIDVVGFISLTPRPDNGLRSLGSLVLVARKQRC